MGVIYLVRHGQADPRAYGVLDPEDGLGGPDAQPGGLTPVGVVQAGLTGALLAAQTPRLSAAISGDLLRQQQTLALVAERFDDPPVIEADPEWNEYELAALTGAATEEEFADGRRYQQRLDASLAHWIDQTARADDDDPSGGESYARFRARVAAAGRRAAELAGTGETVLVVSSAGAIAQWVADLWGVPDRQWPVIARTMVNASVTKLVVGRRGVSVVSVNEHAHLSDREGGVATFR